MRPLQSKNFECTGFHCLTGMPMIFSRPLPAKKSEHMTYRQLSTLTVLRSFSISVLEVMSSSFLSLSMVPAASRVLVQFTWLNSFLEFLRPCPYCPNDKPSGRPSYRRSASAPSYPLLSLSSVHRRMSRWTREMPSASATFFANAWNSKLTTGVSLLRPGH